MTKQRQVLCQDKVNDLQGGPIFGLYLDEANDFGDSVLESFLSEPYCILSFCHSHIRFQLVGPGKRVYLIKH